MSESDSNIAAKEEGLTSESSKSQKPRARPFQCTDCGFKASSKAALVIHKRSHAKDLSNVNYAPKHLVKNLI